MSSLALQTVDLKVTNGVAALTLNRPDSLNAWNPQFGQDLQAALELCDSNSEIRAVVITGAGRAFSSGADLKQGGLFKDDGTVDVLTPLRRDFNPVMLKVRQLPKPVIAAVNGGAAGIGASLALSCDYVIAADSAYFLFAFVNVGLALDGGASPLITARVGLTRAAEIAMLGERVPALQALDWGLINAAVAADQLAERAGALAARLAAGATGAYATIKQTLNESAFPDLERLLDLEAVLQQQRAETADFIEGVTAFVEKRKPVFTGN
jgi:2-(1,2-epoxy-1,2-dihydrophenyl)acetyl-CoA isomerase